MASQKSISKGPLKPTILKGSKNPINKKGGPVEDAENLSALKHNIDFLWNITEHRYGSPWKYHCPKNRSNFRHGRHLAD